MDNLKILRKQHNLKQIDMAKIFNISKSTYSTYETGAYEPNIELLKKIADYFGCSIDYLVGRESGSDKPVILGIMEGYPADEAGMEPGDVITRMNDEAKGAYNRPYLQRGRKRSRHLGCTERYLRAAS